jgi:hypothetical protein
VRNLGIVVIGRNTFLNLNDIQAFIQSESGFQESRFEPIYGDTCGNFIDGFDFFSTPESDCKTTKYGFINKKGKEVIKLKYDWVNQFHEGLASVTFNYKSGSSDKKQSHPLDTIVSGFEVKR